MSFQSFIRGCIINPELEQKASGLADDTKITLEQAKATLAQADKTLKSAQEQLNKTGVVKDIVVLAGLGLIFAGYLAGSTSRIDVQQAQPNTK